MVDYQYWIEQAESYAVKLNIHILSDLLLISDFEHYAEKTALVLQDVTADKWFTLQVGGILDKTSENLSKKSFSEAKGWLERNIIDGKEIFTEFINPERLLQEYKKGNVYQTMQYTIKLQDGLHRAKTSLLLIMEPQEKHLLAFVMINEIDEIYRWIEMMKGKAQLDPLTKLLNRAAYIENINRYLAVMDETKLGAFVEVDADNFKDINDKYGHKAGDEALVALAQRLQEVFYKKKDYVYRMGGDEFAALITDTYFEGMDEALQKLTSKPIEFKYGNDKKASFTVSVGCAFFLSGEAESQIYENADCALYEAKKAGRDTYRIYQKF